MQQLGLPASSHPFRGNKAKLKTQQNRTSSSRPPSSVHHRLLSPLLGSAGFLLILLQSTPSQGFLSGDLAPLKLLPCNLSSPRLPLDISFSPAPRRDNPKVCVPPCRPLYGSFARGEENSLLPLSPLSPVSKALHCYRNYRLGFFPAGSNP